MQSLSFDSNKILCPDCGAGVEKILSMSIADNSKFESRIRFVCGRDEEQKASGSAIVHSPCQAVAKKIEPPPG